VKIKQVLEKHNQYRQQSQSVMECESPESLNQSHLMFKRKGIKFNSENKNRILLVQGSKTGIVIPSKHQQRSERRASSQIQGTETEAADDEVNIDITQNSIDISAKRY
jgi:hypothetical protein